MPQVPARILEFVSSKLHRRVHMPIIERCYDFLFGNLENIFAFFILYIISKIALLVFLSSAHSADFSMHHHVRSYEHSTMIYRLNRKLHFVFRVIFKELQILKRIMDLYCNSLFKLVNFRNLTAHKNTWIGNTFRIRRKAHIHSFFKHKNFPVSQFCGGIACCTNIPVRAVLTPYIR